MLKDPLDLDVSDIASMSPRDLWCAQSAHILTAWRTMGNSVPGLLESPGDTWFDAIMLDICDRNGSPPAFDPGTPAWRENIELKQWLARWNSFGCPIFHLTHSLGAALLLTDCSSVMGADVQWPYPSFLVQLPYPESPIGFYNPDNTKLLSARYLIVHQIHVANREQIKAADVILKEASTLSNDELFRSLPSLREKVLDGAALRAMTILHALDDKGQGVHMRDFLPLDEEPLERWLAAKEPLDEAITMPLDHHALTAASRIVANLCLYIAGLKVDKKLSKPASKPRPKLPFDVSQAPITWLIGSEVKLPREMRDAAREYAERGFSKKHREQWSLRSKFSVRGHWRNQACGTGRQSHRHIWIQPYWKGPQDAHGIGKVYATSLAGEGKGTSQ